MSQKLVTVVLATYNGEKYLNEQLESLVKQTYKNLEIIVQDDCSSDNTMEVLESYKSSLNMQLSQNSKNLGYIKNFETLLKKASGEYICICDQDDIWEHNKIEILLENIGNNSLIYSNSELIDENGNSLNKRLSQKLKNSFISSKSPLNFLYDNCVSAHSMMFKKDILKYALEFPKVIYFDNWIACVAASLDGVKYVDKDLVKYRQHESNTLSINKKESANVKSRVLNKVEKKEFEVQNTVAKIDEMSQLKCLSKSDEKILEELKKEYMKFENCYFNIRLFSLLFKHKELFFKITTRNSFILVVKKSIGKKLYKVAPFL
ncbi:MAG: glycosyltransferase family 2 protein [Campylobacterota bacterium]|nr:glycosyltransferase family 2 protein [Campylobacterota bacterium]